MEHKTFMKWWAHGKCQENKCLLVFFGGYNRLSLDWLPELLPVCELAFSPPGERVAILPHIGHPAPGGPHDLQSVRVQLSSHWQSKKCLHFPNFAVYETSVLALNEMTCFYFNRVELVEICLTKKTKRHRLQDRDSPPWQKPKWPEILSDNTRG